MKILDKCKDYYDYIQGINGIDELIVFDRRESEKDVSGTFKSVSSYIPNHLSYEPFTYEIMLEVGFNHYFIHVHRDRHINTPKLINNVVSDIHIGKTPISFFDNFYVYDYRYYQGRSKEISYTEDNLRVLSRNNYRILDLPILKDTFIPKIISAEEIYNGIYNYLLYLKEPKVEDTRTNKEKIEGRGFDYKESFRNIKK